MSSQASGNAPSISASLKDVLAFAAKGDIDSLSRVTPLSLLSKPDATGMRALHVAASNGQIAVIEWLVEDERRDNFVNRPDEDARTPLHWAAWHGKADAVRALLDMGAISDRPTRTGFTPLHYACFSGSLPTVRVLVEYGAKLEIKDESQQTPQAVAERFDHKEIVEFLTKEAPAINAEAKKRFVGMLPDPDQQVIMDPIMEEVQNNEDMNLERIISTASKVVSERGVGNSFPLITPAKQRQRNLLFGIFMFSVTLLFGMALGKRSRGS